MSIRDRFTHWIASWLDIVCGLVSVLTLTFYRPWWDMQFRCWSTIRMMERKEKIK